MNLPRLSTLIFALFAMIVTLAACAQMSTMKSLPASHPEALAIGQQVDCSECHDNQQQGTLRQIPLFSHSKSFVENHRLYVGRDSRFCSVCHKESFCADCHTNKVEMKPSTKYGYRPDREMPHRGNFMTMHKIEGKLDPASCYSCHGRANNERCNTCHR